MKKPLKKGSNGEAVATSARVGRRRETGRSNMSLIVDGVWLWRKTIYYSDGSQKIVDEGHQRV